MTRFSTLLYATLLCVLTFQYPCAAGAASSTDPAQRHAALLPADTLAVLTLTQPQRLAQQRIPVLEPLLKLAQMGGSSDEVLEDMRSFISTELSPFVQGAEFNQRVRGGVTLALLPLTPAGLVKDPRTETLRSLVLLVTPDQNFEGRLLAGVPRITPAQSSTRKGVEIRGYVFDNSLHIYEVRLGLSFALAGDQQALERLVDFAISSDLSLRTALAWKAASTTWSRSQGPGTTSLATAMVNLEQVRAVIQGVTELVPGLPPLPGELRRAPWYSLALVERDGLLRLTGQYRVLPHDLYQLHRTIIKRHASPFPVPENAALALWSNAPQLLLQDILTPLSSLAPDNPLHFLLGERFALILDGSAVRTPLITLPRISLSVQASDPDGLLAVLQPSISDALGPPDNQKSTGKDNEMWTWDVGLGTDNRIALARRGSTICLGLGVQSLQRMMRAAADWDRAAPSNPGEAAMHGLMLRGDQLAAHLRPVCAFLSTLAEDQEDRRFIDMNTKILLSLLRRTNQLKIRITVREDGTISQVAELSPAGAHAANPEPKATPSTDSAGRNTPRPFRLP